MKPFGVEDWPSWATQCSDRCIPTCGIWDPKITDLNTSRLYSWMRLKKLNGPDKSIQFYDILWMEEILHQLVDGLCHCNPIIYSVL